MIPLYPENLAKEHLIFSQTLRSHLQTLVAFTPGLAGAALGAGSLIFLTLLSGKFPYNRNAVRELLYGVYSTVTISKTKRQYI